jgi:hypothetical protein
MTAKLNSDDGKARYAKRRETVEPVFGQIKDVRGARRLLRHGLAACEAEWKLLCGTHNLLINRPSGLGQTSFCGSPWCFRRWRWLSRLAASRVWRAISEC